MKPPPNSFQARPLPKSFVIELTKRCNNHCVYCYLAEGPASQDCEGDRSSEMSTQEVTHTIAKLCDEAPVQSLALSGGEPLLRDDIPEILSFMRNKGISPVVITNGTLLSQERVASAGPDVTYEITLLSYRREVHDQLAGRRGAWDAAVDGMANVRQAKGDFVAVFVATKLNSTDVRKTAELAIALGASGLMYNRMNLGAHNLRHVDRLLPTVGMIRENLDTLEELSARYQLPVAVSVVIEPCVIDTRKYKHLHFGWCPLAGEGSYFTIDPQGNLRVCNHSGVTLGNLKQDRFIDIYDNHPYVRAFRDTWPAECESCDPELRALCCGGCKASAEQCYGSLSRVDPFVTISRQAN
jgi:radical SAM protein with 4Fe4S-binding SPASM domain